MAGLALARSSALRLGQRRGSGDPLGAIRVGAIVIGAIWVGAIVVGAIPELPKLLSQRQEQQQRTNHRAAHPSPRDVGGEVKRQSEGLELIASENFVS